MESRWMRRKNENGEEEKFYPITHAKAIVYSDDDKDIFNDIEAHLNDTNNPHGINDKISYALLNYSDDNKANVEHTHTMSDILDFAQSNWNQDDETAPDYIKNRTHYDNRIFHLMYDESYHATSFGSTDNYTAPFDYTVVIGENKTYTVRLNGVSYSCVSYRGNDGCCLGNASLINAGETNTGEDFCIFYAKDSETSGGGYTDIFLSADYVASHGRNGTVQVTRIEGTLKKLNESFIPDDIVRTSALGDQVTFTLSGTTLTITSK